MHFKWLLSLAGPRYHTMEEVSRYENITLQFQQNRVSLIYKFKKELKGYYIEEINLIKFCWKIL